MQVLMSSAPMAADAVPAAHPACVRARAHRNNRREFAVKHGEEAERKVKTCLQSQSTGYRCKPIRLWHQ